MVPLARHGPQRGACHLWVLSQVMTLTRMTLAYFLGPGTAWELQFKDVVTQVLKENQRHVEKKHTDAASSLWKCNNQRTKLHTEFDAMS